jgi:hypothetical protein
LKSFDNVSTGAAVSLDRDFSEFVALFTRNDVRFLVVGGYALAAHGLPRATGGFDAWVWVDTDNAVRIVWSLDEFGFVGLNLSVDDFNRTDVVAQLGFPPHRINIMTSIDGVDFEKVWERKVLIQVDGQSIPFISKEDLITNKRVAGRPEDVADVARLTESEE